MAIVTRFGTGFTPTSGEYDADGTLWLKGTLPDGREREYAAYDLKADGGLDEIMATDAAKNASEPPDADDIAYAKGAEDEERRSWNDRSR